MTHRLSALIFDVDGTLAETERDGHRVAFNESFMAHSLNWFWSDGLYGELLKITGGKERLAHFIEHYQPDMPNGMPIETLINTLHQEKNKRYLQILQAGKIPLRPGVLRLLNAARNSGVKLAIATTTTLENVHHLLSCTLSSDAINWFDVIAAGDVVAAKKPAPDIYFYALEKLQLPANECVAIEDSANGLQAALQAELTTLITLNDYTANENFTGAALVVNQLGEPDAPCQAIAGSMGGSNCVDLALFNRLINRE
ncbi:HAD family hydrolase [Thioflexithrix psekupsensis]|uniref:Phosphatase n=1 Tax=Thioflexithrix psekupsensis TaxID=1570016 RepID=A0A251X8A0_9GAMM|nr:HAD family hydrolase [Thioflexithrix psekupsensis]OUD13903.1 phosphatase [Thioflexithrix psekupsensis]